MIDIYTREDDKLFVESYRKIIIDNEFVDRRQILLMIKKTELKVVIKSSRFHLQYM